MTSTGIFLVGFAITRVVFTALGILAYGIALERRDLDAEKLKSESVREEARTIAPASPIAAPSRSTAPVEPPALGVPT